LSTAIHRKKKKQKERRTADDDLLSLEQQRIKRKETDLKATHHVNGFRLILHENQAILQAHLWIRKCYADRPDG
jgi:hypothetical protein